MPPTSRLRYVPGTVLLLFALLSITFLVYQPGLYGDYLFDDFANITTNSSLVIESLTWQSLWDAAVSSFSGPFKRPVSMLSFAFNASTTGFGAPLYFKLTGLFVHLLTGVAVYWLAGLLLDRFRPPLPAGVAPARIDWTRLLITGIWLLHPLNLTTVLYIVQRMTSLSALFAFVAAGLYCVGRVRLERRKAYGWVAIGLALLVAMPLSVLSKENGILVPVLLCAIEITAFDYRALAQRDRISLGVIGALLVVVPGCLFVLATVVQDPRLFSSYKIRDFDIWERLFTQGRVFWFYIFMAIAPRSSSLGVYHDDMELSTSLFQPLSTLFAWVGIVGLLALAGFCRRRQPAVTFGLLWFFAGHLLESTVIPLEIAHEHRNYLPVFGLIFSSCYVLLENSPRDLSRRLLVGFAAVYWVLLSAVTFARAEQWGNPLTLSAEEVENHPESERAQLQLGRMFMILLMDQANNAYYEAAKAALTKSATLAKSNIAAHVSLVQLAFLTNRPYDQSVLDAAVNLLGNGPIPPAVAPSIRVLVDCQLFAYCKLPDSEVIRLGDAALSNPRGLPSVTTQVAIFLTQYYIDKMGDGDRAVATLRAALKKDPESPALNLAAGRVYRVVREFELAQELLNTASRTDTMGVYKSQIESERDKLRRDVSKQALPHTRGTSTESR